MRSPTEVGKPLNRGYFYTPSIDFFAYLYYNY